jgi:molybdopterin molybdotransferase
VFGKSGLLNTLTRSNGVIRIPAESEGLEAGELVEVWLW